MKKPKKSTSGANKARKRNVSAPDTEPDFKKIIDKSPQGIVIHSNFRALYANKAFASLVGYKSPNDILKMPLLRSLFSPDLWAEVENKYDDLMRRRVPSVTLRMPILRKNGREEWVTGTATMVDWCGKPAVKISVFNISDQVAVEQSLLRAEQHLRAVLEILPYPIYISSRSDGRLLFVNRKTCLLFQRSAAAMLRGTSIDFYMEAKERENIRALFDTYQDVRDVEVRMKTGSGREFIAELSAIRMEYNGVPAILAAVNDITERKAMEAKLQHLASTDPLTQIGNRRHFMTQAEQEFSRSRRFGRDLSVMMLDVDHFKPINDTHGHAVGDAVLQGIVRRSNESLRQSDLIARLGGEEFAVLLPETNLAAAQTGAERLREHLAESPIIVAGAPIHCTVSIGLAQLKSEDVTIDDLLRRADEAMYRAKEQGRDRVEQAE